MTNNTIIEKGTNANNKVRDHHAVRESLDEIFELSEVEMETMRRAAQQRRLSFDPNRRCYTKSELIGYGLVREGYTRGELTNLGFTPGEVSCFDPAVKAAENLL